jgi:spermidine/putrescine transport system substrate-binding protein
MKRFLSLAMVCAMLAGLAVTTSGCGSTATNGEVNVYNWGEYIDEDIFDTFTEQTGIKVNYTTYSDNESLYSVLASGSGEYDVIIPSDYMIARMIDEGMLEELDFDNIPNYANIDDSYKGLEYDPDNLYSVAYMWGTVGIIYNTTMVEEPVTSWDALWDERYSGQILMFDNSRDAIAIALEKLGYSINTTDEGEIQEAVEELIAQKPLLQAYVMDQIFDKMDAGDAITMIEENPDLAFCLPEEGSNLFVDAMCIPKGAANKENAEAFINFMCDPETIAANCQVTGYSAPSTAARALLDEELASNEIAYPSEDTLSRCNVFINLPENILSLYDEQWTRLKSN